MRVIHTLNLFLQTIQIPGDVIELGVSRGTTTFPLSGVMYERTPKKVLYACDTFSGLPYDDSMVNGHEMKKGECNGGHVFKNLFNILKPVNIQMVEGLVENTLEQQLGQKQFCFAWVDMDLYQPTSFAYKFLENRMVVGGIIGFHDYQFIRCPGIAQVVDFELNKEKYQQIFLKDNCIYFRRMK